ncbi:MAG: hypothetical protein Q4B70_18495, partial [Lachnospiraceae bacterium]|nr:hypothetical protein [Lachnospiraceae bacterium]
MNKKNRKKGLFSATAVVIVLIVAIAANVVITKLDWSYDVSQNQMYTLSEQTESIVKENKQDITLYVLSTKSDFNTIYKKIVNKHKTLDQIYDLFAVRAIVKSVKDCYGVLGVIHEMYTPIPGRFKDY